MIPPKDMEVEKFHGALVQRLARFVEVFASLAVRSPSFLEASVYRLLLAMREGFPPCCVPAVCL